jgi:uncharacterized membrane protein
MSKSLLVASLSSFVLLVVIDFIWLTNASNFLYKPKLGPLLLEKPVLWVAALFYLLYAVGIAGLVLRPAVAEGSIITALWMGALLGLVAYGTYDLTNQATIKGWSLTVTVVDMAWGAFVTGVVSAFGVWVSEKVG